MADDIKIRIGGDATGFANSLKSVKAQAAGVGKIVASGFSEILGPLSGIASVAGVTKVLADVAKKGADIADGSKRIGVTAEEYQKMSFAAQRSGASIDAVESSVKKMSKVIYDAGTGSDTAAKTLGALGLTLDDLKGKSPEEQFSLVARALDGVQDATTKAALAQQIFGKSGSDLIPMLNNYESLKNEMETIGGVMSNEAVKAADDLNASITNLSNAFQTMVANTGVVGWLADVAEGINAVYSNAKRMESIRAHGKYGKSDFSFNPLNNMKTELKSLYALGKGTITGEGMTSAYLDMDGEGEKIYAAAPYAKQIAKKQEEMVRKRKPDPLHRVQMDLFGMEHDLQNWQAQTTNQNIPEKMRAEAQTEVNKLMVEYKKLLGEAANLGDSDAKAALEKVDAEIKAGTAFEKIISQMEYKLQLQKNINTMSEEEARIQQAVMDAGGDKLKPAAEALVRKRAKEQIDAEDKQTAKKVTESVEGTIAGMAQELEYQELINSGKERQASIEKALNDEKKRINGGLTEPEQKQISELAGDLFDAKNQNKSGTEFKSEFQGNLVKMGAYFGGGVGGSVNNPQKKANEMLSGIKDTLNEIAENTNLGKEYI